MILVVGATGVLGQKTARLLLADGHQVRAHDPRGGARKRPRATRRGSRVGDLVDPIRSLARAAVLTACSPPRIHFSEEASTGRKRWTTAVIAH